MRYNKYTVVFCSVITVLYLAACGGQPDVKNPGGTDSKVSPGERPLADAAEEDVFEDEEQSGTRKPVNETARIKGIDFLPKNIFTDSRIEVQVDVSPPLEEGESLSYIFHRNSEMMSEQGDNSLPPETCKKGDSLYVDVLLSRDGEEVSRKRSPIVLVMNSKPEIGQVEWPEIRGNGVYNIVVNATDADDEPLTFALDGQVPAGMTIDETTGVITYAIETKPEQTIKFKVVVKDPEGAGDWRELFINFGGPQPQQPQ